MLTRLEPKYKQAAIGQPVTLHCCVRAAGSLRGEEPKGELEMLEEGQEERDMSSNTQHSFCAMLFPKDAVPKGC